MTKQMMTKEDALAFLCQHQPLPDDEGLNESEQLIKEFDQVRQYFIGHPDPACIPLFLNAFSNSMGFGVYQLCDDVFRQFDQSLIIPHLKNALCSQHQGVRWWAAHWSIDFPSAELVAPLEQLLANPIDEDAHYFALATLACIWTEARNEQARDILEMRLEHETDPSRIELINEVLQENDHREKQQKP